MIRAKIPIYRTQDGLWKAGLCSIHIDSSRRIPLSAGPQEEALADLVETVMGQALLALDKNGRRGTSEPIQWEIFVDGVPYCYRCVEPMQERPRSADGSTLAGQRDWTCAECGTVIQVNGEA
ncbi:MAG: hypothetical protein K0S58_1956 [Nitrospira sp.]|jgi:hypothetical protein|nr:hypothetical protein [Nitrospira sp.]